MTLSIPALLDRIHELEAELALREIERQLDRDIRAALLRLGKRRRKKARDRAKVWRVAESLRSAA